MHIPKSVFSAAALCLDCDSLRGDVRQSGYEVFLRRKSIYRLRSRILYRSLQSYWFV